MNIFLLLTKIDKICEAGGLKQGRWNDGKLITF